MTSKKTDMKWSEMKKVMMLKENDEDKRTCGYKSTNIEACGFKWVWSLMVFVAQFPKSVITSFFLWADGLKKQNCLTMWS